MTDSSADTVSGKIVLTDGTMPAQTFVMGGTAATTTASNSITTITVKGNNMSDLATAIAAQLNANGDTGATAVAGNSGLVITSGTKGNTIAATTNDLLNTNARRASALTRRTIAEPVCMEPPCWLSPVRMEVRSREP